jgi:hypothetical protein
MLNPARFPLKGNRFTAFNFTFRFVGLDLTGSDFWLQVRQYRDADGEPLADLEVVEEEGAEGLWLIYAGTDTVAAHMAAGRLSGVPDGMAPLEEVAVSLIGARIAEATMRAMPPGDGFGSDERMVWDMHVEQPDRERDVYATGDFIVAAGVVQ